MKILFNPRVIFVVLVSSLFGFFRSPLTESILLMTMTHKTNAYIFDEFLHDLGLDWPLRLLPYLLLSLALAVTAILRPNWRLRWPTLLGLIGASFPVMYVDISIQIYRLSPGAHHGGYTGDALAMGFSWMFSFVTLLIGFSIGCYLARKKVGRIANGMTYLMMAIGAGIFIWMRK